MATSDSIKIKAGSTTHNIKLMKYKNGSDVKTITSVWYVNNGNKNLVWPKSYDAVLEIVPTYSGNLNAIPASGTGNNPIGLKYYLTVYLPNTTVPVTGYNHTEVTNSANNWISIKNNNTGNIVVNPSGYTNKASVTVENRSRNGLPAFTGPDDKQDPESDGSWTYHIDANKQVIINNVAVTASDSLEFIQLANSPTRTAITPTNVQLNCYNDINLTSSSRNTQSNPASYTQTSVYGRISGTLNYEYTFTSGATYVVKHYVTESIHWDSSQLSSDSSWAVINPIITNNERFEIVLREKNTTTSARKAVITLKAGGESHSFDVWQAGVPDTTS